MHKDYARHIPNTNQKTRAVYKRSALLGFGLFFIFVVLLFSGVSYMFIHLYAKHVSQAHSTKTNVQHVLKMPKKMYKKNTEITEPKYDFYTILPKIKVESDVSK